MSEYFSNIPMIKYEGPDSNNPLAYHYYDAKKKVLGKTMEEHLRIAVCYWHTFCWDGIDMFGEGTFSHSWMQGSDPMDCAKKKLKAAFTFFEKLGIKYFTFHDYDVAPEGSTLEESNKNMDILAEAMEKEMSRTKVALLWGTAKLALNKRYMSGAATNPDPEIFTYALGQVKKVFDITAQLKGHNYVLWGGREGYETLLNTDLKREQEQLARFFHLLVDYKHKIGFKGTLLIEPKPCEPTKHQYDFDCATVFAFLQKYGLEKEFKMNIEGNHATLANHTFSHEVAYACANDIFCSIDANQGDAQLGWDVDMFPADITQFSYVTYLILKQGGFRSGGFNLDAKVRRQSTDDEDLFHGHILGIDTLARSLLIAEKLLSEKKLESFVEKRYSDWDKKLGKDILEGKLSLEEIAKMAKNPKLRSGKQEMLENILNQAIY